MLMTSGLSDVCAQPTAHRRIMARHAWNSAVTQSALAPNLPNTRVAAALKTSATAKMKIGT
jgi:hypothetical protein